MSKDMNERLLPPVEGEEEILSRRVWKESKKLWVVATPAIFTRFSTFGVSVVTQAYLGHVGAVELAAYAVVFTVLMRFCHGILLGMASGLETLCGQSFGAKQHHMLGIYLQRSWVVLIASFILILPIYLFTTPILRLFGQDESIAIMGGQISLWFIPISFSFIFSFTFQMFLQAQSKNIIVTYTAVVSLSLHIFLSWLLVVKLSLGVAGAMGSMIIAVWIPNLGQFAFVFCGGCPETWRGFSSAAFSDLVPVIKLSLSSGVMMCLEMWYYSILILITGNMRNAEVQIDALSICLNISGWELMIAFGFLAAASVRVSNELGAGRTKDARFSIIVVVATSLSIGSFLFVLFLLFRGRVAYIFSKDIEIVRAVADLSPLLAFSILLNSVQPVLSGVALGAGWQSIVAYVNITCYYVVGIPLGILLGYLIGYQVKGIWIGMMLGTTIQTIILVCITWRTDWDKQVSVARARLRRWLLPDPERPNVVEGEVAGPTFAEESTT